VRDWSDWRRVGCSPRTSLLLAKKEEQQPVPFREKDRMMEGAISPTAVVSQCDIISTHDNHGRNSTSQVPCHQK
jgi:hypothetical protein